MAKKLIIEISMVLFCMLGIALASSQTYCHKCGKTVLRNNSYPAPTPIGPIVIRPKTLPKPQVTLPLYGTHCRGPCFRKQTIVKPAVILSPVYGQKEWYTKTPSAAQTSNNPHHAPSAIHDSSNFYPIDIYQAYEQAYQETRPSIPADMVSLALAHQRTKSDFDKIPEDKLGYGFRKLPFEHPKPKPKVHNTSMPEGNLYSLNGQILELRPVEKKPCFDDLAEEAEEELINLALSEEEQDVQQSRRPSLTEIGFRPAKINSAAFVEIPSTPLVPATASESSEAPCIDGSKSDSVVYKDVAHYNGIGKAKQDKVSCESREEVVKEVVAPKGDEDHLQTHSSSKSNHSSSNCSESAKVHHGAN